MFPCSETSGCITFAEITRYIVYNVFGNPNIDVKNFENPVTPLINSDNSYYMNPGAGKGYEIQY